MSIFNQVLCPDTKLNEIAQEGWQAGAKRETAGVVEFILDEMLQLSQSTDNNLVEIVAEQASGKNNYRVKLDYATNPLY